MPRLMDQGDWARTVANVSSSRRIWCEDVSGNAGPLPFLLPEGGTYQVILVKLDQDTGNVGRKRKSAHDLIGYGKRFNRECRPTAEIMRELREGEDA